MVASGKRVVVVAGTSGVGLQDFASLFISSAHESYRILDFERGLEEELGAHIIDIVDSMIRAPNVYATTYRKAVERLIGWLVEEKGNVLLTMHLSYLRRKHVVPNPALFQLVRRLADALKALILVVEDYYHALDRVREAVEKGIYLHDTIDPLLYLQWRAMDFGVAMSLYYNGVEVLVVGAKHRVETLKRLGTHVLDSKPVKLAYFSHSIRSLREKALREDASLESLEEVREIEEFKTKLIDECKNLVLFEPTTIDELIFTKAGGLELRITRENRWPHSYETVHSYRYPIDLQDESFTAIYDTEALTSPSYVDALRRSIEAQIATRDFLYVNQSSLVLAYRPSMGGRMSRGSTIELVTAAAQGKPVYLYAPDDREYSMVAEFFTDFVTRRLRDFNQLVQALKCE